MDVTGGPARSRSLYINGTNITRLTIVTKVLAYVPKAARPNASTLLSICFGMGTTYRSAIILGLHTTAVDLDPTEPSVMSWFYPDASKYLHSPLGQVVINDGRNYVRLSDKRYDLIDHRLAPADLERWRGGAADPGVLPRGPPAADTRRTADHLPPAAADAAGKAGPADFPVGIPLHDGCLRAP